MRLTRLYQRLNTNLSDYYETQNHLSGYEPHTASSIGLTIGNNEMVKTPKKKLALFGLFQLHVLFFIFYI